jgi:hypothetical protein
MWGLKVSSNKILSNIIFNKIINSQAYDLNSKKGKDQIFLKDHIYYLLKNISVIHDSYLCKVFLPNEPWPTKREGMSFVGYTDVYKTVNEHCPIECRPVNHKDWLYC